MSELKEKALDKMLVEMNQAHSGTEDAIHNWLCVQSDDELFKGILDDKKTIKQSVEFCGHKAKQAAVKGVAMVTDDEVFAWITEYFKTPDVKFDTPNLRNATTTSKPRTNKPKPKKAPMTEGEQLDLLSFL